MSELTNFIVAPVKPTIAFDQFERIDIRLTAEIIWIKKMAGFYRAGLRIIDIDSKDLLKLKNYLKKQ